ncbi:MAG: hypothetical protein AB1553_01850 [Nitrospirota bacterium]
MSYSVNQKCYDCKKQPKCSDGNIIQAAVSLIHTLGTDKGHLGGGSITHECTYGFEDKNAPEAAPAGEQQPT